MRASSNFSTGMNTKQFFILSILAQLLCVVSISAQTWQSSRVYYVNNRLVYTKDSLNNRIPDFSYAGYKRSEADLPNVPVVRTLSPIPGDNTAFIQAALDSVGALTMDPSGIRGAVLLLPGVYQVYETLKIPYSGVVLRGSGQGADSLTNTIIWGRGDTPHQRTVIVAGYGGNTWWKDSISGTTVNITTPLLSVGERKFAVASAKKYAIGDNIIIYHPCTAAWLQAINYGGTDTSAGWAVGEQPIVFNRRIVDILGDTITIDAPVYEHLDKSLSQCFIYKYARKNMVSNIGIENLRVDIEYSGATDENHAWDAIDLNQLEDSWVKDCTMLHFGMSGIQTMTASRITVQNCSALDPISILETGKRYNFNTYVASQLILFKDCQATNGRHHYVSNGHSYVSGIVFLNCKSSKINASSEGHRRWSQGLLFDNYTDSAPVTTGYVLGIYDRGSYGTSHGWASVHSVIWNSNTGSREIIVQQPPTAQNYAIGCTAKKVTGVNPPAPFTAPTGFVEGTGKTGLYPQSLFLAQLADRQLATGSTGTELRKADESFTVFPAFPNPFNPETKIRFHLPASGNCQVTVYDITGRLVTEIFNGLLQPGAHEMNWSPSEQKVSSGIYFIRVQFAVQSIMKKVVYLK
jgi:hypothetical protein